MLLTRPIVAAAAIAAVVYAAPAAAHGYNGTFDPAMRSFNGTWPVTITDSQRSNGTGCLTLNGNATQGQASLVFGNQRYQYGSFMVSDDILVVTISEPLYGQNGAIMFISHVKRAQIGQGVFENIEGGSNFDAGMLAYGKKNGC